MANGNLEIKLWDVGQGIAIWINTPNGQNHWIDAGKNTAPDFDPAKHVHTKEHVNTLDYLIISHPDTDHYNGLYELRQAFNKIDVLLHNREFINNRLKDLFPHGHDLILCKQALLDMHKTYTNDVPYEKSPRNPNVNGGIDILTVNAPYTENISVNNSSIVVFYKYNKFVFIAPGDIEQEGWEMLYKNHGDEIRSFLQNTEIKVLVAPHHGRESGYTQAMIDAIKPSLILISDEYGKEPTDKRFYTAASGVNIDSKLTTSLSTKTLGRIEIKIDGSCCGSINTL